MMTANKMCGVWLVISVGSYLFVSSLLRHMLIAFFFAFSLFATSAETLINHDVSHILIYTRRLLWSSQRVRGHHSLRSSDIEAWPQHKARRYSVVNVPWVRPSRSSGDS